MALPNIFSNEVAQQVIERIQQLSSNTPEKWGKMNVAQMLAHCNVSYEMVYTDKHPKPSGFVKFLLKLFVKGKVVGEGAYGQNGQTAPAFIITGEKDFEEEKNRLIAFIEKTQSLGLAHFEGKESHSFGALNGKEWNNLFYKHIDHHLKQFGV